MIDSSCEGLAMCILQDFLVSEQECNSVDFEATYSRKNLKELLVEIYDRMCLKEIQK